MPVTTNPITVAPANIPSPQGYSMELELSSPLYDISGAVEPDTRETMVRHWQRFRGIHGKRTNGLDYMSLQTSWYALIKR